MVYSIQYNQHNIFFTSPNLQPDTASLYVKRNTRIEICQREPLVNFVGKYIPIVGSLAGIGRIISSVRCIFIKMSGGSSYYYSYWFSIKNIFRGIVETCPCSGIFLMIYDGARNYNIRTIISNILKNNAQDDIAGIVFDLSDCYEYDLTKIEKASIPFTSANHALDYVKWRILSHLETSSGSPFAFSSFRFY
jgi:hypothetical protein